MPYSWLTFVQGRQQLAARLADPTNQFWTDEENGAYIVEALRAWNALTFTSKISFTFTLAAASVPTWLSLGTMATSPRLRSVTDVALYTMMEYHLLEPPSGGTWTGTEQFSIADLSKALSRCRDEAIQFANTNQDDIFIASIVGDRFYDLPDNCLDVPRIRWADNLTTSGTQFTVPGSPSSAINTNTWVNPDNILLDDGNFTEDDLTLLSEVTYRSSTIDVVGFGFTIPNNAIIDNIRVSLKGLASDVPTNWEFQFLQAGTPVGFASQTPTGTSVGVAVTDITPTSIALDIQGVDVNDPLFGMRIDFLSPTAGITADADFVSLDITYHVPFFSGDFTTLVRTDNTALNFYQTGYLQTEPLKPTQYNVASIPALQFEVDIAPVDEGVFDLIVLLAGEDLTPPTPSLLHVPDDNAFILKWGALADLLSRESEATDDLRAAYCKSRYKDGLKLMASTPWIMQAYINFVPADLVSVTEMDSYRAEWDSAPPDFQTIVTAGIDYFTVVPDPDNAMNVGMTVLGNAVVPVDNGDFIQISRDAWDAVLDYAQFLAAFKQGGSEFVAAIPLEKNFYREAMKINGRLEKLGLFADVYEAEGTREIRVQERFEDENDGGN